MYLCIHTFIILSLNKYKYRYANYRQILLCWYGGLIFYLEGITMKVVEQYLEYLYFQRKCYDGNSLVHQNVLNIRY